MAYRTIILENDTDNSFNPLDTELGCREPAHAQREFLVDFLVSPLALSTTDGARCLARDAINAAYRAAAVSHPKKYRLGLCPDVDDWVHRKWSRMPVSVNWWQIVDLVFEDGSPLLAKKAQVFAVPLLEDVLKAVQEPGVFKEYMNIIMLTGENLPDFFSRHVRNLIEMYPVFSGPSSFDRGDTSIDAITDLHETVSVRLNTTPYELDPAIIPDLYREYHDRRHTSEVLHKASRMAAQGMDAVMADPNVGPQIESGIRML